VSVSTRCGSYGIFVFAITAVILHFNDIQKFPLEFKISPIEKPGLSCEDLKDGVYRRAAEDMR
jgi:hypothetical protein